MYRKLLTALKENCFCNALYDVFISKSVPELAICTPSWIASKPHGRTFDSTKGG
jgi:hypothetical protein